MPLASHVGTVEPWNQVTHLGKTSALGGLSNPIDFNAFQENWRETNWWYTYPSEKYEFVSWDEYSQWKVIKFPWFQTTNQETMCFFILFSITTMDLRAPFSCKLAAFIIFIQWESEQLATTCTPTEMTSVPSPVSCGRRRTSSHNLPTLRKNINMLHPEARMTELKSVEICWNSRQWPSWA